MADAIAKGKKIGQVTHYFGKIGVAVLKLTGPLKTGDQIVISGRGEEYEQTVDSMQVDHQTIPEAKAGDDVGMKVAKLVKPGDEVYLKG